MKIKFSFYLALSAGLIALCAAYYSVFGLSQLFAGASTAVIIMASSLEFSKVVAVSFLHRYWDRVSSILRVYLTIGVLVLILITSGGIYGFLSNAYQKTANKLEITDGQLGLLNSKKQLFEKNISDNQNIINTKTTRVQQLTNLRTTQEVRLDAATNNSNRNRVRADIESANKEIQKLNIEIDTLNSKNTVLLDSVNFYSTKTIELKSNDSVSSEIGPLKYLSQLTGYPMDKVVNWFILLLIFVFDPLAVCLVIATNRVLEIERGDEVSQSKEKPIGKKSGSFLKGIKKLGSTGISRIKDTMSRISEKIHTSDNNAHAEKTNTEVVNEEKHIENNLEVNPNTNRGFSSNIPNPRNNVIERIGTNKVVKDNEPNKVFYKRRD